MRNCFSNSTTWRSKKRTTAALHTLFSQLYAFLTALRSCASLVSIFRLCHAACIGSIVACSSASVRAFLLQPRPYLLPSWSEITNSAVRMKAAACGFCVVHTAVSMGVCPEVPSNRCGHLLSKLEVSHQAPTVHWWFSWGPQPAVSGNMAEDLDRCGHNVVVRNGEEGGTRVHRNVPYEFAITLPR